MHQPTLNTSAGSFESGDPDFLSGNGYFGDWWAFIKIAPTENWVVKIDQIVHNSASHWPIMLKCSCQIWCS